MKRLLSWYAGDVCYWQLTATVNCRGVVLATETITGIEGDMDANGWADVAASVAAEALDAARETLAAMREEVSVHGAS